MSRPVLFVSVGTDHHPFDRLVRWTDAWVERQSTAIDYTVQHGASEPSRVGTNVSMLPHPALLDLVRSATIVVTQGGPGSIVDVRSCDRIPIVVPRARRYDEVVDDHQVPFCRLMSRQRACLVATDEPTLHAFLDLALRFPDRMIRPALGSPAAATALTVRRHLARAARRRPGWVDLRRVGQMLGRPRPDPLAANPSASALADPAAEFLRLGRPSQGDLLPWDVAPPWAVVDAGERPSVGRVPIGIESPQDGVRPTREAS